jgi:NAD-dependent deacetylase
MRSKIARSTHIAIRPEDRVFVLTGAGISAESGLATFRGSDGLWEGERVQDVASPRGWKRDPERVWRFYSLRRKAAAHAEPNPAHFALAELEHALGTRYFLCTQNVDNLHERGGSHNLVHMHGELFESRCDSCARPPFADVRLYESELEHVRCECGGRIRPNIVWFGETPFHLEQIFEELQRCTVMLVVGTSGAVQPAASFVHWVNERPKERGAVRTYYVGLEHPANAEAFTQVFEGRAGELLPQLLVVK